jgi:hypothetical protein
VQVRVRIVTDQFSQVCAGFDAVAVTAEFDVRGCTELADLVVLLHRLLQIFFSLEFQTLLLDLEENFDKSLRPHIIFLMVRRFFNRSGLLQLRFLLISLEIFVNLKTSSLWHIFFFRSFPIVAEISHVSVSFQLLIISVNVIISH